MPLSGEKYYTLIAPVRSIALNRKNPNKGQVYIPWRSSSTKAGVPFSPSMLLIQNVKKHENSDLDKLGIISENKGKCGIYRCRRSR